MEDLLREVEQQQQNAMAQQADMPMDSRQLLLKLYEAAIRNVKESMEQIDAGESQAEDLLSLGKAYWIIEYLIESLDYQLAPELCADLEGLYHSMMRRMTRAYNKMESAPLVPVLDALRDLHETWVEAVAITEDQVVKRDA
jgi:flagellar biosynthetic protein FliS